MAHEALHILLVEDSTADARIFQEMLRAGSYSLTHVVRLEEALKVLAKTTFHLVLLDLGLPDSKGLGTLRQMRDFSSRLPVIVLTGLDDDELGLEAVRSGAQEYLIKGQVDHRQLVRAIRYAIERNQAVETLIRDSEERFSKVSTTARDAIVVIDHLGNISKWNDAAERVFGYTWEEVSGRDLHQLVAPIRYIPKSKEGFATFLQTGQGPVVGQTISMTAKRKDGREFPVELSVSAFQDHGHWQALAIIRDTSERKYAERLDRLSERLASVGQMAHAIAKEVDQPLLQIAEGIKDLKQNYGRMAPGSGLLRKIASVEKDVARVCHISRELLSFSRLDSIYSLELDIHKLLEGALVLLRPKMRNISVQCRYCQIIHVVGDPVNLEQVFYHLMANATEAMPDGGTITITTLCEEEHVEIIIADTGPGIPETIRTKVFDPYFTTKAEMEGTGLGLSICHRIIQLHSGSIAIADGANGGAEVTVRLPAIQTGDMIPTVHDPEEENRQSVLNLDKIYNALSNPIRRKLLQLLGENQFLRLVEMVTQVTARDHTVVLFHLRSLRDANLIVQDDKKNYALTAQGREVYAYSETLKSQLAMARKI